MNQLKYSRYKNYRLEWRCTDITQNETVIHTTRTISAALQIQEDYE